MIRDRAYLDSLRDEPCLITGLRLPDDPVEAVHIGTAGKGLKSSDDEALPIRHSIHAAMHQRGEMTVLKEVIPNWLLREAMRAYARELYRRAADVRSALPGKKDAE